MDLTLLFISLTSDSEILTIVGTTVVHEFETIAMLILLVLLKYSAFFKNSCNTNEWYLVNKKISKNDKNFIKKR